MSTPAEHSLPRQLVTGLVVILISPFLIVYVPVYLLVSFAYGLALHVAIWIGWCTRGKYMLIVYSNSPVWQPYFASQVLPALEGRAVVLNWSERATWRTWSLAVLALRYFGGNLNFNPMVIVFRPGRFRRVFRFWGPFRDFKHGKPQEVERMKNELMGSLPPARGNATTATPKTGSV